MSLLKRIFSSNNTTDGANKSDALFRTRTSFIGKIAQLLSNKTKIDDDLLSELEEILIQADIGVETTLRIISKLEEKASGLKIENNAQVFALLNEIIQGLLKENKVQHFNQFITPESPKPYVIMVVGVNGVGKTTTIGKLAHQLQQEGKKVVLGAGDTFRAAAVEQIKIWGERTKSRVVSQQMGADTASVAFDTLQSAIAHQEDIAIIDTAGRLHNKVNLMNELGKIKQVMQKLVPDAPHEVILVLDASTGQNAYEQAKQFTAVTKVNTLALTKLDGTAKGGVAIGISDQMNIPIKYIGIGEGLEDLRLFDKKQFVESIFTTDEN
jgi:fused signal recognition particle receptor